MSSVRATNIRIKDQYHNSELEAELRKAMRVNEHTKNLGDKIQILSRANTIKVYREYTTSLLAAFKNTGIKYKIKAAQDGASLITFKGGLSTLLEKLNNLNNKNSSSNLLIGSALKAKAPAQLEQKEEKETKKIVAPAATIKAEITLSDKIAVDDWEQLLEESPKASAPRAR